MLLLTASIGAFYFFLGAYETSSLSDVYSNIFKICILLSGINIGSALQPVGLTGGIACGKSSVASLLLRPLQAGKNYCNGDKNIAVVDVDGIAHSILDVDGLAYKKIVKEFGSYDIFDSDHASGPPEDNSSAGRVINEKSSLKVSDVASNTKRPINRKKLGQVIFGDATKRRKLNGITHPLITQLMLWEMIKLKVLSRYKVVVVDIPLLFEGRLQQLFGFVVVVACSPDNQYSRLRERNPDLSEKECRERIASQIPVSYKVERADYVVFNDAGRQELEKSVDDLMSKLLGTFDFNFVAQVICIFCS
eukprot:CAMPEP_0196809156 /NCGR_PEP_ID=MMETSP1362-20130617/9123_1 /TAXON_ID=163516 /ORGANISM="Leptocylindrus danicus, Strain CCMP1856" /LENGTH=305 /DNA_ID=CAMNT_0042183751 /DNA_START=727 /DNA_END=1641 /DNA_ORIENTATION=-